MPKKAGMFSILSDALAVLRQSHSRINVSKPMVRIQLADTRQRSPIRLRQQHQTAKPHFA